MQELQQIKIELKVIKKSLLTSPILELTPIVISKKVKAKKNILLESIKNIINMKVSEIAEEQLSSSGDIGTSKLHELCRFLIKITAFEENTPKEFLVYVIKDFISEISTLNKFLTNEKLPFEAKEFSLAFCGQLARLLIDSSTFFIDYSPKVLLEELETLIIERGNLAHNSVARRYKVQENTYQTMVHKVSPLLSLVESMLDISKLNPENFADRETALIGRFNDIKQRFLSIKSAFEKKR